MISTHTETPLASWNRGPGVANSGVFDQVESAVLVEAAEGIAGDTDESLP